MTVPRLLYVTPVAPAFTGNGLAMCAAMILEALREIVGLTPVPTHGKIVIFDLLDMSSSKHVILRKPWCPACFPMASSKNDVPQSEKSKQPESA